MKCSHDSRDSFNCCCSWIRSVAVRRSASITNPVSVCPDSSAAVWASSFKSAGSRSSSRSLLRVVVRAIANVLTPRILSGLYSVCVYFSVSASISVSVSTFGVGSVLPVFSFLIVCGIHMLYGNLPYSSHTIDRAHASQVPWRLSTPPFAMPLTSLVNGQALWRRKPLRAGPCRRVGRLACLSKPTVAYNREDRLEEGPAFRMRNGSRLWVFDHKAAFSFLGVENPDSRPVAADWLRVCRQRKTSGLER